MVSGRLVFLTEVNQYVGSLRCPALVDEPPSRGDLSGGPRGAPWGLGLAAGRGGGVSHLGLFPPRGGAGAVRVSQAVEGHQRVVHVVGRLGEREGGGQGCQGREEKGVRWGERDGCGAVRGRSGVVGGRQEREEGGFDNDSAAFSSQKNENGTRF